MSISPKDVVLFLQRLRQLEWCDARDDEMLRLAIAAVEEMCPGELQGHADRELHKTLVRAQERTHGIPPVRKGPIIIPPREDC